MAINDDPSGRKICVAVSDSSNRAPSNEKQTSFWSAIFSRVAAKVEGDRPCGPWLTLIEGEGDGVGCLIMSYDL